MDIGIGLDATLNLSFADQANLAQEVARLRLHQHLDARGYRAGLLSTL